MKTPTTRWTHSLAIASVLAFIICHISGTLNMSVRAGFSSIYSWIHLFQAATIWAMPVLVICLGKYSSYALTMYLVFPTTDWIIYLLIKDHVHLNYIKVQVNIILTLLITAEIAHRLNKLIPRLGATTFLDKVTEPTEV